MPSLRRTLSSPVVRPSPYPTSLSEQAAVLRAQGSDGHRRSSGSESIGRRVLADIEWWRVVDGQCMADHEHSAEDVGNDEQDPEQTPLPGDRVQPPLQYSEVDSLLAFVSSEAVLVVPSTPPQTRHVRESSASSLESTPELPETTVEGMRLDLEYLDLGAHDAELPPYTRRARSRTHSFTEFFSQMADSHESYADFTISPLSSSRAISN